MSPENTSTQLHKFLDSNYFDSISIISGDTVESQIYAIFGVNSANWTPEQHTFYASLSPDQKAAIWDNLPDQIEQELGDRIEELLKRKAA